MVEYKFSLVLFSYTYSKQKIKRLITIFALKCRENRGCFMAGDLVSGEPILSLEAMKMQNEVNAPCNGVIRKIHVQPGQSVMQDELLVEIDTIDE